MHFVIFTIQQSTIVELSNQGVFKIYDCNMVGLALSAIWNLGSD